MANNCTMCGKKIGGFGSKEFFFDTELELCITCQTNVDIMKQRLENAKSLEDLESRYNKIVDDINNKYSISDENKDIFIGKFANIYNSKKSACIEIEALDKIIKSENERKKLLKDKESDIDTIIEERKNNSDIENILKINDQYEYEVVTVTDDSTGGTNLKHLQDVLTKYSMYGWKLKTMVTNELGKNSRVVSGTAVSSGVNSTIDQLILVFERKIRCAKI